MKTTWDCMKAKKVYRWRKRVCRQAKVPKERLFHCCDSPSCTGSLQNATPTQSKQEKVRNNSENFLNEPLPETILDYEI